MQRIFKNQVEHILTKYIISKDCNSFELLVFLLKKFIEVNNAPKEKL